MSRNRDNILWQSADGLWNLGVFETIASGEPHDSDYGYDSEWDVEVDFSVFFWASRGYATMEDAARSWDGPNMGGNNVLNWSKQNAKAAKAYDVMGKRYSNPTWAAEQDAKAAKARLAKHTKALKTEFAENNDFIGEFVTVRVTKGDVTSGLGWFNTYTGRAYRDGDWLIVDGFQVKNMKTGRLNREIVSVKVQQRSWY